MHELDPEVDVRDAFGALLQWSRDRDIELARRYWRIARAHVDRHDVGWLTIPEPPLPIPWPSLACHRGRYIGYRSGTAWIIVAGGRALDVTVLANTHHASP